MICTRFSTALLNAAKTGFCPPTVVLYSPNGVTRTVCDLAERVKEAIENKAVERNGHQQVKPGFSPQEFDNGNLSYNVFVITGTTTPTLAESEVDLTTSVASQIPLMFSSEISQN